MEITDFAAAIPDHQSISLFSEACLMSGIEVAYELRNKTDYLLASSAELLVPGYAPVYPTAFQYLFDTSWGCRRPSKNLPGAISITSIPERCLPFGDAKHRIHPGNGCLGNFGRENDGQYTRTMG